MRLECVMALWFGLVVCSIVGSDRNMPATVSSKSDASGVAGRNRYRTVIVTLLRPDRLPGE
jgi:hypothetical protein